MKTPSLESAAFSLQDGTVTTEHDGSKTFVRFAAPATRHFDGGLSVSNVNLLMFDDRGRFVGRKGAMSDRSSIGGRASWEHEVDRYRFTAATRFAYDVEYKFDYRRRIIGCELPALAPDALERDFWRWTDLDPNQLSDRLGRLDAGIWIGRSGLELTFAFEGKFVTEFLRMDFEAELLDADRQVVFAKTFGIYQNCAFNSYEDASIWTDQRALIRSLRFFELAARVEAKSIVRLPIES